MAIAEPKPGLGFRPAGGFTPSGTPSNRLLSLDAFRGFTMICMIGEGFGLLYFLKNPALGALANQFQHVDWNIPIPGGIHFWDLIQPFFMFLVGAVMPMSFARRWAAGESWTSSFRHVLRRCALLILFGLIARSCQARRPVLDLINVLAQIAFTYLIAFLVLRKRWTVQAAVAFALLGLHWALYQFGHAPGVLGPWVKDGNIGWYLDGVVLHKHWGGSYATINCISSAANTIFGVMAGELLASAMREGRKLQILTAAGVCGVALGFALDPLIPLNKKIWTASFALYSTGMTLLALALFYWIFDVKMGGRKGAWGKLFVVVGSNSIFIYLFHEILHRYLLYAALFLLGAVVSWWPPVGRMFATWLVLGVELSVCYVLYRRGLFLKV